jgi:hypothetical protein
MNTVRAAATKMNPKPSWYCVRCGTRPGADVGPCPAVNGSHVWRELDDDRPLFCKKCGAVAGSSHAECSGGRGKSHAWTPPPTSAS